MLNTPEYAAHVLKTYNDARRYKPLAEPIAKERMIADLDGRTVKFGTWPYQARVRLNRFSDTGSRSPYIIELFLPDHAEQTNIVFEDRTNVAQHVDELWKFLYMEAQPWMGNAQVLQAWIKKPAGEWTNSETMHSDIILMDQCKEAITETYRNLARVSNDRSQFKQSAHGIAIAVQMAQNTLAQLTSHFSIKDSLRLLSEANKLVALDDKCQIKLVDVEEL